MNIKIKSSKLRSAKIDLNFFLDANYRIFPFLWVLAFFIGLLESFTYVGYSTKHLFLPFQVLFGASIFSGVLAKMTIDAGKHDETYMVFYRIIFTFNKLGFLPLFLSFILAISLELRNYSNYVYNIVHLQPALYFWPIFLSLFLLIISFSSLNTQKLIESRRLIKYLGYKTKQVSKLVVLKTAVIVFAVWMLMNNLQKLSSWMTVRAGFMIKHPLASYGEKMRQGWGDFYSYMLFIKANTPENAVIMYPPMKSPWDDVGNGGLIRYFLYPREIVQNISDENAEVDPSANYVMIAWGFGACPDKTNKCHGWPKRRVSAEWIRYVNIKSLNIETTLYNTFYNPADKLNIGAWGVIKVKK